MKKNKGYTPQKRTTFLRLFLKAVCVSLICTAIFAGIFREILSNKVKNDVKQCMTDSARQITTRIAQNETTGRPIGDLSGYMSMYTRYFVLFDKLPEFTMRHPDLFQINSDFGDPDNFAMSAIVDKNGNIIASSRAKFTAVFLFGKDNNDNGLYICDSQQLDFPEVKKLYEDYYELLEGTQPNSYRYVTLDIESAYVDKTTHYFIPHEADMQLETYANGDWSEPLVETKQVDSRHVSITLNDDNFELVTFHQNEGEDVYPRRMMGNLYGTSWECFDNNKEQVSEYIKDGSTFSSGWYGDSDELRCSVQMPVYVGGEQCTLNLYYNFVAKGTIAETYYRLGITAFGVLSVLLALLWAWQKNVRNKSRYAFEDHQRALTNDLAHDIKTPLTAIGGYAENLLDGDMPEEQRVRYLRAIMDNVSYTDSMITRTLELNRLGAAAVMEKESIDLIKLAEQAAEKYALLLDERNITVIYDGSAVFEADRASMTSAVENLVSNAVKYTAEGGQIKLFSEDGRFVIENTVSEAVDTTELKLPFRKGDKSRSGRTGSGLGLSIADTAAAANGFSLEISCSSDTFRAEIIR